MTDGHLSHGYQRLYHNVIKRSSSTLGKRIVINSRAKCRLQLSAGFPDRWSIYQQLVTDCTRENCRLFVITETLMVGNNA